MGDTHDDRFRLPSRADDETILRYVTGARNKDDKVRLQGRYLVERSYMYRWYTYTHPHIYPPESLSCLNGRR